MMQTLSTSQVKNQRGIGLVEILITIVILAIGFLASARMQVEGMRFSQSAYFQSQAYFLSSDMINRMRTNYVGAQAGGYDNINTTDQVTDPGCDNKACTDAELALQDIYDWGGYLHSRDAATTFIPALPSSDSIEAYATVEPISEGLYTVRMVWSEIIGSEDTEQSLSVNFALKTD